MADTPSDAQVKLKALTPAAGLLPVTYGAVTLEELTPARITSFAPWNGREKSASAALKKACGMALPVPGRATGKEGARAVWTGRGQAMVLGIDIPDALATEGAMTDQSDAWAVLRLSGATAEDVLARLVPVDLRVSQFKRGHTARTQLQHMMVSITRTGALAFDIMVMRSFAVTAVHDLSEAMKSVATRG